MTLDRDLYRPQMQCKHRGTLHSLLVKWGIRHSLLNLRNNPMQSRSQQYLYCRVPWCRTTPWWIKSVFVSEKRCRCIFFDRANIANDLTLIERMCHHQGIEIQTLVTCVVCCQISFISIIVLSCTIYRTLTPSIISPTGAQFSRMSWKFSTMLL